MTIAPSPSRYVYNASTGYIDRFPMDKAQTVTVCAAGGAQYTSIQSAINAVTDAAINKPYVIEIYSGTYVENITLKPYVALVGKGNGPAAPTIVGTITSTTTGLEWVLLNRINHSYTITADGQSALNATGSILANDYFVNVTTAGDYAFNAVSLAQTTSPYGSSFFACYVVVTSTFDGSTKAINALATSGTSTQQGIFFTNSTILLQAASASGFLKCYENSADASLNFYANNLTVINTKAAFSGTVEGFCILSASVYPRLISNCSFVLQGVSGGTANGTCLDTSGNSGTFTTSSCSMRITGFANIYASIVGATDTQKDWLMSMEGNYGKTGSGLCVVTPYDLSQSGFVQWSGTGAYYSYNAGTREFTVLRAGIGLVRSSPVSWAVPQTVTLPADFTAYFIYIDDDGLIQQTTDPSFSDKILLFSIYSDGTNYAVSKQTHPVSFPADVSSYEHNAKGSTLKNDSNAVLTVLVAGSRTVKMVGASTYFDHGLNTTVADSGVDPISIKVLYTGASGATFYNSGSTTIPSGRQSGTSFVGITNGKYVNMRVGVYASNNLSDSAGDQIAQYILVPDSVEHNGPSAAANQIIANTVASFPTVASGGLEVINLGFITMQGGAGNSLTTGTITTVTPAKQVSGVNFASGSSSSAGTVTTDTSNFNGELSATETSVQLALDRLDDYDSLQAWTTGRTYRIGNVVLFNSGIWRANTAHTASAAWATDAANWDQVAANRFTDVTAAEAASGKDATISYVFSTDTWYRYLAAGGAYTRNGTTVLNTAEAGNTRRIAVAGQYHALAEKFAVSVAADTISEYTSAAGVTVDGVLLKDATVAASGTGLSGAFGATGAASRISITGSAGGGARVDLFADTAKFSIGHITSTAQLQLSADGTNVHAYSTTAGAWTLGPSGVSTVGHILRGEQGSAFGDFIVSFDAENATAGNGGIVRIGSKADGSENWISSLSYIGAAKQLTFYAGSTDIGKYSSAGAWTLGPGGVDLPTVLTLTGSSSSGVNHMRIGNSSYAATISSQYSGTGLVIGQNLYSASQSANSYVAYTTGTNVRATALFMGTLAAQNSFEFRATNGDASGTPAALSSYTQALGLVSNAGAWTLGPANGTGFNMLASTPVSTLVPNSTTGIYSNCRVTSGSRDGRAEATYTGGAIECQANANDATAVIYFYANQDNDGVDADADEVGKVSAVGAWTLGASGTTATATHTSNGVFAIANKQTNADYTMPTDASVNEDTTRTPFLFQSVYGTIGGTATKGRISLAAACYGTNYVAIGTGATAGFDGLVFGSSSTADLKKGLITNNLGSMSNAGAWTLGPSSSGALTHTVNGSLVKLLRNDGAGSYPMLKWINSGTIDATNNVWAIQPSGTILTFYSSANDSAFTNLGGISNAGAWTLGPAANATRIVGASSAGASAHVASVGMNTSNTATTLTTGQAITVTMNGGSTGYMVVITDNSGNSGTFFLSYISATVVEIADPSSIFEITDTGSTYAVYKSATSNDFTIKNKYGSTKSIRVCIIGGTVDSVSNPA